MTQIQHRGQLRHFNHKIGAILSNLHTPIFFLSSLGTLFLPTVLTTFSPNHCLHHLISQPPSSPTVVIATTSSTITQSSSPSTKFVQIWTRLRWILLLPLAGDPFSPPPRRYGEISGERELRWERWRNHIRPHHHPHIGLPICFVEEDNSGGRRWLRESMTEREVEMN